MKLNKIIFISSIFISSNCIGQNDTLYYKYDVIIAGLNCNIGTTDLYYNYKFQYDSIGNRHETTLDFLLSDEFSTGLAFKSKYMSFGIKIKSLSADASSGNKLLYSGSKAFAFNFFLNKLLITIRYNQKVGAYLYSYFGYPRDTLIGLPKFKHSDLSLGADYFFSKKFSFSRANSGLYFPKKSVFGLAVKSNFMWNKSTNDNSSFLTTFATSGINNIDTTLIWNHAKVSEFYGIDILPGVHCFLTKNQFKHPNSKFKYFCWYYYVSVSYGPSFFSGKTVSLNESYNTNQTGVALNTYYIMRSGINTRYFYFEINSCGQIRQFKQRNFILDHQVGNANFLIAFRIPFKKGYEKTDAFMKKINPFKKKEKLESKEIK